MDVLRVENLDEWSQVCSESFVPMQVTSRSAFHGTLGARELTTLSLSRVAATPSTVRRSQRLVRSDPRDVVLLSLYLRGTGAVAQAGHVATLSPGDANLLDADRPYTVRLERPNDLLILRVPRQRLGVPDRTLRERVGCRIDGRAPGLQVLRGYLTRALVDPDGSSVEEHERVAGELLDAALHPLVGRDGRPAPRLGGDALYETVRWFLQRHASHPDLSIEEVARLHGVTRRALELHFARHGTSPAAHLRALRLARARELLLADPVATVASIAGRVGFRDATSFIRAFHREVGLPPERWRRQQILRARHLPPLPDRTTPTRNAPMPPTREGA